MNSTIETIILLEYGHDLAAHAQASLEAQGYRVIAVDLCCDQEPTFGAVETALIVAVSQAQYRAQCIAESLDCAHCVYLDPVVPVGVAKPFKPVSVLLTQQSTDQAVPGSAYVERYPLARNAVYRLPLFTEFLSRASATSRPPATQCCCCGRAEENEAKLLQSRSRGLLYSSAQGPSFTGDWLFSQQVIAQRQYDQGLGPWFCVGCSGLATLPAGLYGRAEYGCRVLADNGLDIRGINLSPRFGRPDQEAQETKAPCVSDRRQSA
ncbi:hypothetical protein EDC56_3517 [Sinobacterium caligoides]|uniref:Uncharacterized protein n=1 Tax=Sinobacterium caligoides TaxID=933926 RepID=A0A3N2DGJ4_9GAMM|nr:hypothetical protein [Sinobacterium caligoides]ROR98778.1 hypothetical protein EDC56_3517 [Sinobacterium caligoides]